MNTTVSTVDVIILGAGASGLMCAITAAKRGRRVVVLEKANKVGKKILMSGGGRCNFTNQIVAPENYISTNPHFCKSALKRYTQWDFIAEVQAHNIAYEERKHSQLFCKNSAKDILNMLLDQCEELGVVIKTHCEVEAILGIQTQSPQTEDEARYSVKYTQHQQSLELQVQSLVVATGALSIPTLGGSGYGYKLAEQFGLQLTNLQAGLVPFMFSGEIQAMCARLSGLSVDVEVTCNHQSFKESLLFTHRGMSGPVILQISNYWSPGDIVVIDLMPEVVMGDWLLQQKQAKPNSLLRALLNKALPKALVLELQNLWWPQKSDTPLAQFADKQLLELGELFNGWPIKPAATEGYRTAEVTLGGVHTQGLSSKTMEVKSQAGLYFIGEVVDVTGHLGGFNFQWAWSSGYAAGSYV